MTDFDFEELDKAVNTALGTSDTSEQPAATPAPQAPRDETPVPARPAQTQPAPAMRRSSGRFMDVVHPSSDMRTSTGPTRGVTLNPISNAAPEPTSAPTPAPTPDTGAGDLLDDFDWNAPLDSPFLPDAQVEKRPLGGSVPTGDSLRAALENESQLLLDEPDEPRLEAPDELQLEATVEEHTMPDPIDFAENALSLEPVVEEQPVVESIEEVIPEAPVSSEPAFVSTEPINSEVASDSDLSHAAALDAESHFVPGAEEVASSTIGDVATVEEHTGPVSITQQYKEKPAEAAVSGAIYDTENYHQPITTPVKKKSGAWVILWIFLILLVGGGGGAAFYFFVLPSL